VGQEAIPGHRLIAKLGSGGFGEVWSATGPDGAQVAMKFISCQGKPASAISHEIRTMRRLQDLKHPHFIRLYGVCPSASCVVIIMERADCSLKDLQTAYQGESGRRIPTAHVLELLEQAAVGLDSLAEVRMPGSSWQEACLQHCDVKPSNLLLVGDTLKVADFG